MTDRMNMEADIKERSAAHTGKDGLDTGWFMDEILYPPDSTRRMRGADVYGPVMRDDQVRAALTQRLARVVAMDWEVVPGGDRAEDLAAAQGLRQALDEIDFDRITKLMLHGLFYGYSVAEVMWRDEGARVGLADIKVRDRGRFMFGRDGSLRLRSISNLNGEPMPDRKFWVFTTGADHGDNPYGLGLAHWLYWPVYFKRGGIKSWVKFLDKYGAPTAKGVFPRGATEEEKRKLLDALRAISTDAGIIVPEGMQVELIEAARGGQAEYAGLYDRMNEAIAKVILTQTMTLESGSSYSQSRVHWDVGAQMARDDADTLMQSFNRSVAVWLCQWNFPGARPPKVWRRVVDRPSRDESAELDGKIAGLGYGPTADRVRQVYGEGYEKRE